MPGIVGLITRMPHQWAEQELLEMVRCLDHGHFLVTGTWVDEELGVYVGWVARTGSFSDGMPVRNEQGDVSLVFSGEDFPEPETVCRLKKLGHSPEAQGAAQAFGGVDRVVVGHRHQIHAAPLEQLIDFAGIVVTFLAEPPGHRHRAHAAAVGVDVQIATHAFVMGPERLQNDVGPETNARRSVSEVW